MNLTMYAIALAVGGTMILASIFMGGDEIDLEVDGDVDAGVDAGGALAWLPIASIRFWTFFLGFAGLTGVLLRVSGALTQEPIVAIISGVTGYLAGIGAVKLFRKLQTSETDSSVRLDDYAGVIATVTLSVAPGKTGKVTADVRGRVVELMAESDDGEFAAKEQVMILEVNNDGKAVVTQLEN